MRYGIEIPKPIEAASRVSRSGDNSEEDYKYLVGLSKDELWNSLMWCFIAIRKTIDVARSDGLNGVVVGNRYSYLRELNQCAMIIAQIIIG